VIRCLTSSPSTESPGVRHHGQGLALRGVSYRVAQTSSSIIGQSGSRESTLLNIGCSISPQGPSACVDVVVWEEGWHGWSAHLFRVGTTIYCPSSVRRTSAPTWIMVPPEHEFDQRHCRPPTGGEILQFLGLAVGRQERRPTLRGRMAGSHQQIYELSRHPAGRRTTGNLGPTTNAAWSAAFAASTTNWARPVIATHDRLIARRRPHHRVATVWFQDVERLALRLKQRVAPLVGEEHLSQGGDHGNRTGSVAGARVRIPRFQG
jgi:predicted ABC-type transport system involved in lysophospholipase L1 biosynthesis ATPase subunit